MPIGGFSRSQAIEIANRRTEKRGASLDLGGEFLLALQEVCLETRWWWRRLTVQGTFKTGIGDYDLTDPAGFNAADFHQAAKDAVVIYTPGQLVGGFVIGNGWSGKYVTPEFNPREQDAIIALRSTWTPAQPCRYFVQWPLLKLDFLPDRDYQASIGYWAVPNWTDDTSDETIPLVPNYAQSLIIKRLEIHIERFALGEGAEKYEAVVSEYNAMVAQQQIYNRFADGQMNEIRNGVCGDAIQSS